MLGVWSFSEAGGHPANEDDFRVRVHPLDSDMVVCVVSDGQGGRSGGGEAARLACRVVMQEAADLLPKALRDQRTWADLLARADRAVEAEQAAGYTTVVGLAVTANRVVGGSSGDSAAILVTGAETVELTRHQRKNPPVGSAAATAVAFEAEPVVPWRLLVMTDGVWKYVGWPRVVEIARRAAGDALLAELQAAARLPGSGRFQDDFTVVLIESVP